MEKGQHQGSWAVEEKVCGGVLMARSGEKSGELSGRYEGGGRLRWQ